MSKKSNLTVSKHSNDARQAHPPLTKRQQMRNREACERSSVIIDALKNMDVTSDFESLPWSENTQFIKEVQDASAIEESTPLDPVGYLYASAILSVRGNSRGALAILEKGIRKASRHDRLYPVLESQISRINKDLRTRPPDAINRVPSEVLLRILSGCSGEMMFECLNVCQRWRSILLHAHYLWYNLMVEYEDYQRRKEGCIGLIKAFQLLPAIARHVQSLVFNTTSLRETAGFFRFMKKQDFSSLRSLSLSTYTFGRPHNMVEPVYHVLKCISGTLTDLSITSGHLKISLYRVLSICRKLTKLRMTVFGTLESSAPEIQHLKHITALTELDLYVNSQAHSLKNLESLFQQSPELRFLRLSDHHDEALETIEDHCPNLVVLIVNPRTSTHSFNEVDYNAYPTDFAKYSGLRFLMLGDIPSASPLASRIRKCHSTLEALYICPAATRRRGGSWVPLSGHVMINMKSLHVDINGSFNILRSLPLMLQAYPNLTTLELKNCTAPEDIFQVDLSKLDTLILNNVDVKEPGLGQLFARQTSSLKHLTISGSPGAKTHLVAHLSHLRALETLNLWGLSELSSDDLSECTKQISELPHLYCLDLGAFSTISPNAVYNLVQSKSLIDVKFQYVTEITVSQEELLRDHFPKVTFIKR